MRGACSNPPCRQLPYGRDHPLLRVVEPLALVLGDRVPAQLGPELEETPLSDPDRTDQPWWASFPEAVRKVAAGDNFISPQLAKAVTFSAAAIKASPATQMSPRELEILRLLGRGDKIVEVAKALSISYKTVANTTSLLKQKLGAKNHSDLIRIAVEMGLG